MTKSLFVACLLCLGGCWLGCGADASGPAGEERSAAASPMTQAAAGAGAEPDAVPDSMPDSMTDSNPDSEATSTGAPVEPEATAGEPASNEAVADYDAPSVVSEDEIQSQLQQLDALEIFEVGALLRTVPGAQYGCAYNQPCPGEEQQDVLREQRTRLGGLLSIAREVHESAELPEAVGSSDAHLATLDALSIIHVGALIVDEPASSPFCYNLPCPEDVEAADVSNSRRAQELAALAQRASDL